MKFQLVVLVLAAVVSSVCAMGVPSSLLSADLLRARNDAVCNNRTYSCRDCNTVTVCAYLGAGYNYLTFNTCPDSAPYCENGACVRDTTNDTCKNPAPANDFTCFDGEEYQGYYPAPFDCSKYYVCSNAKAYVYNCPEGHIYDHAIAGCTRKNETSSNKCFTFPCAYQGQYILYKPDEAIYAFCTRDYRRALISKCLPNYRINPLKPNEPCKPYCARVGRIANVDNPRSYFECLDLGSGELSEPQEQFCPIGMAFDDASKRCQLNAP